MIIRNCLPRLNLLTLILLVWNHSGFSQSQKAPKEKFEKKIIAQGLKDPWSIDYGPDNHLWITESKGYKLLRVNPADGHIDTIADLNVERKFPRYDNLPDSLQEGKPWPQGGLMGLALHPDLMKDKSYIYLAFVYEFEGSTREGNGHHPVDHGFHFKTKIVRYTYHLGNKTLINPRIICDSIPGSNDHNGGRLLISKVKGVDYLFYTVGDMGAGQYDNAARINHAQDPLFYEGKILRFKTDPGKEGNWIPEDNPFGNKNAVWSLGHRNPQGLTAMKVKGEEIIYSSEHGPFSDDEINIIKKGGNYGHPLVIGYVDGNYDGLSAAATSADSLPGPWNTTYPLIVNEQENSRKLNAYQDPLWSFYPTGNQTLKQVAEMLRSDVKESPEWESIAPSGIASYNSESIHSWEHSMLVTSLKQGCLFRLMLNAEGNKVLDIKEYFKGNARYRDVTVSSDGKKIYLITDISTITSGPTEDNPESTNEKGAIIEYTYMEN
jgi:PQQ-dependent dehydrogenase (s-GDH family)